MCKYNLTQDNFQLVGVVLYSRQVEPNEQLYDLGNGIVGYYVGKPSSNKFWYYGTKDTTTWEGWDMYIGSTDPT